MANESPLSYDFVMYIMKIIFLAITVIVVSVITYTFVLQDIKVENMDMQLIREDIYNSELIMYKDPLTMQVYPGVVDLNKFKSVDFSKKLATDRKNIAFRIELFKYSNSIGERFYVSDGDDDKTTYNDINVLRAFPERLATLDVEYPVIIKNGFNNSKGTMIINILLEK